MEILWTNVAPTSALANKAHTILGGFPKTCIFASSSKIGGKTVFEALPAALRFCEFVLATINGT